MRMSSGGKGNRIVRIARLGCEEEMRRETCERRPWIEFGCPSVSARRWSWT